MGYTEGKKVVVGMSGGVDSSVAAYLLKKQGYQVTGVTMRLWQENRGVGAMEGEKDGPDAGFELTAAEEAARVAEAIGIPHYVFDFEEEFKCHVVDYFVEEYLRGRTPNPCIVCNRHVKWAALLERSLALGADYIATGHYARIARLANGRYALRCSITGEKDQTYALYRLTQEQLAHTLMPVGEYEKSRIRAIAQEAGLPVADKPDSQEICFIPDQDYASFIDRQAGDRVPGAGNFVDNSGNVLGRHKGITHYTIGQRRGLELAAGERIYVTDIRPDRDEVVLGRNEDIFTEEVFCEDLCFMSIEDLREPVRVFAKIRYNHKGEYCRIEKVAAGKVRAVFEKPVRAATPGQSICFYDGEYVLGGGVITGGGPGDSGK